MNPGSLNGKTRDLSAFGVRLGQWTNAGIVIDRSLAEILISDKKAFDFRLPISRAKWVRLIFRFQGTGKR